MNLTFSEGKLFYDLYAALLSFVNRRLEVSPVQFSDSAEYTTTPPEARVAIRDALFEHRELIDEFVAENPAQLKADDLEIVATWKHAVVGKFYVFRYLKSNPRRKHHAVLIGHPDYPAPWQIRVSTSFSGNVWNSRINGDMNDQRTAV